MLQEMFAKLSAKRQEHRADDAADVCVAIVQVGNVELGIGSDVDLDLCAEMFAGAGLSENDVRANVDLYLQRRKWVALAIRQVELLSKAEKLRSECEAQDAAEIERRIAAKQEWVRLSLAASAAERDYENSCQAENDLLSSAASPDDLLRAENFRLIRHRPSRDERKKHYAAALGWEK